MFGKKKPVCDNCGAIGHEQKNCPQCICGQHGGVINEHRAAKTSSNGSPGANQITQLPAYPGIFATPQPYVGTTTGTNPLFSLNQQKLASIQARMEPPSAEPWKDEVYRGWRMFQMTVDMNKAAFTLTSGNGTEWQTDTLKAYCQMYGHMPATFAEHAPQCACGIYLFGDKREMMQQMMEEGYHTPILAECVGWGTVIEAELGYRVEYCRIEGLWTGAGTPELNEYLSKRYGVPCKNLWDTVMT